MNKATVLYVFCHMVWVHIWPDSLYLFLFISPYRSNFVYQGKRNLELYIPNYL